MSKRKNGKHISGDSRKKSQSVSLNVKIREYKNYFDTVFENSTPRTIDDLISFSSMIRDYLIMVGIENHKTSSEEDWSSFKSSMIMMSNSGVYIENCIVPLDGKSSRTLLVSFKGNTITRIELLKDYTPTEILFYTGVFSKKVS